MSQPTLCHVEGLEFALFLAQEIAHLNTNIILDWILAQFQFNYRTLISKQGQQICSTFAVNSTISDVESLNRAARGDPSTNTLQSFGADNVVRNVEKS